MFMAMTMVRSLSALRDDRVFVVMGKKVEVMLNTLYNFWFNSITHNKNMHFKNDFLKIIFNKKMIFV